MNSIKDLLKYHIEKNGYTVYSISYKANINRSTLQKIIQGDRALTDDIYNKLIPHFNLSPQEMSELDTAYLVNQIGMERYESHMQIKNMFEAPAICKNNTYDVDISDLYSTFPAFPDTFLISNSHKIIDVLFSIIKNTANPYIYSFCTLQNNFLFTLYRQFGKELFEKLDKKLLIEFAKVNHTGDNLYNLTTLTNMISLVSVHPSPIEMYYFYGSYHMFGEHDTIESSVFPYYIIINNYTVLLSADCENALFLSDENIHNHYLNSYNTLLKKSSQLNGYMEYPDLLEYLISNDVLDDAGGKCMNVQPCITLFIDEKMVDKYIKDIEEKDIIKQSLLFRKQQLFDALSNSHQTMFFTPAGLKLFSECGICTDFAQYMNEPFTVSDRIYILEHIIEENNNGNTESLLLNEEYFSAGINLQFSLNSNETIFMVLNLSDNVYAMTISEHTLYESIMDFINTIPKYGYAHSIEETNDLLRNEISNLLESSN